MGICLHSLCLDFLFFSQLDEVFYRHSVARTAEGGMLKAVLTQWAVLAFFD